MSRQSVPKLSKPGVGAVIQKSFRLLRAHAQHFFIVAAALVFPLTLLSSLVHTPTFNAIVTDTPGLVFTLVPANWSASGIRGPADLQQSLLDFPTRFHAGSRLLLQQQVEDDATTAAAVELPQQQQQQGGGGGGGVLGFLHSLLGGFEYGSAGAEKNLTIPDDATFSSSSSTGGGAGRSEEQQQLEVTAEQQQQKQQLEAVTAVDSGSSDGMVASFTEETARQLVRLVALVVCDLGAWLLLRCVSEAAVAVSVAGSYLGTLAGLPGQPKKVFFTRPYFRALRQAAGRVFLTLLALGSLFTIIYVLYLTTLLVEYSLLMLLLNVPALTLICTALTTLLFGATALHVLIVTALAPSVAVLEGRAGWPALSRSAHLVRASRRITTAAALLLGLAALRYLLLGLGLNALLLGLLDFGARLAMGHKSPHEFARTEGVVHIPWMVVDYQILFDNTVATAVGVLAVVVHTVLFFFCKTGCGEHLGDKVTFGLPEAAGGAHGAGELLPSSRAQHAHDSLLEFVSPRAPLSRDQSWGAAALQLDYAARMAS